MGARLRPDLRFPVRAAAAERIVAFGRPGKSLEVGFWQLIFDAVRRPIGPGFLPGRNDF